MFLWSRFTLTVICTDGQHRLEAMRQLHADHGVDVHFQFRVKVARNEEEAHEVLMLYQVSFINALGNWSLLRIGMDPNSVVADSPARDLRARTLRTSISRTRARSSPTGVRRASRRRSWRGCGRNFPRRSSGRRSSGPPSARGRGRDCGRATSPAPSSRTPSCWASWGTRGCSATRPPPRTASRGTSSRRTRCSGAGRGRGSGRASRPGCASGPPASAASSGSCARPSSSTPPSEMRWRPVSRRRRPTASAARPGPRRRGGEVRVLLRRSQDSSFPALRTPVRV